MGTISRQAVFLYRAEKAAIKDPVD